MSKLQINTALILTLSALVLLPTANAITIYTVDSTTGALLNSTISITYNQYQTYQEFANSTNTSSTNTTPKTILNASGEYYVTENSPYLYINYSKTSLSTNFTWQVKAGPSSITTINLTNATTYCYNAYADRIVLRMYSNPGVNTKECYNGTAWVALNISSGSVSGSTPTYNLSRALYDGRYDTDARYVNGSGWRSDSATSDNGRVYEEGGWWGINSSTETVNGLGIVYPPGQVNYTTANITVSVPGYTGASASNVLLSGSNYTFNLTTSNNVTFRFVDEITGLTLNTTTSVIQLSSTVYGTNATTTNGTVTLSNVTSGLYTVTYYSTNYTQRTYSIQLPQSSSNTVVLYLLPTSEATTVRFTITDTNNFRLTNATVYINKKNTSGTNYYLVATCTTDTQGQCVSNVQLYDTTYQFFVYYAGAFRTNSLDTIVTTTEIAISVPLNRDPLQVFYQVPQISSSLTFDGTTATWTVLDSYGNAQQGCVRIFRRTGLTTQQINGTCTTGAAFTISTTISTLIGDENYALGTIYVDGQQLIVARESVPNDDLDAANNTGLVLLAVVFAIGITLAMKYSWDMTTALVMFMLSTTMFWYVGLLQLSSFALVSVGVFLMIIISRNNQ